MTKIAWALKIKGDVSFRDRARERTASMTCRKIEDDSFGKDLLLTGTSEHEISLRSRFPSPPTEFVIIKKRV
jgi:hypothetical protein